MKKISTFSSKGSMKFLLSSLIVIIIAIVFILTEQSKLSNYIFICSLSYYIIVILYYKFMS